MKKLLKGKVNNHVYKSNVCLSQLHVNTFYSCNLTVNLRVQVLWTLVCEIDNKCLFSPPINLLYTSNNLNIDLFQIAEETQDKTT